MINTTTTTTTTALKRTIYREEEDFLAAETVMENSRAAAEWCPGHTAHTTRCQVCGGWNAAAASASVSAAAFCQPKCSVCVRATVQFQLSRGFGKSDGRKSKDEDRAPRIEYGKCAVQWRWNIDTGNETSEKTKPAESTAGMSLARASGLRGLLFSLCVPVKHTADCV